MKKLTYEEFKLTISEPNLLEDGAPVFDFWAYVRDIPENDYEGHDCTAGDVYKVYRMNGNEYEHVLIFSKTENVFMALVNDIEQKSVYGHCLLDFNKINSESSK